MWHSPQVIPRPSPESAKASGTNGPGATGGTCTIDAMRKFSPSGAYWIVFFSGPSRATNAATPSRQGHMQVSCPEFNTGLNGDLTNGPNGVSAIATPCMRSTYSEPRSMGAPL